mgnify:FL=1
MIMGLAERLQKQRMNMKLSQKEVAVAIGVSPSVISNYEVGARVPSLESLIALAGLYRCSTDYLLGLEKSENVSIDASMLNDEQKRLLQYFLYGLK